MTYKEYHNLLLNELIVHIKVVLRNQKLSHIIDENRNHPLTDGKNYITLMDRFEKINNLLLTGKIKADNHVNFKVLGFKEVNA
jgi:hypothetical protein